MAAHGGRRKGAGRRKGSRNRKTLEQIEALNEGQTPLEYLVSIYQDETQELRDRIDAAKAAAPYVHSKLSSVEVDAHVSTSHEDALDELEGEEDTPEA